MISSIALVPLLAVAAYAQIPSGTSEACAKYLTELNANTALAPCTSALISGTSGAGNLTAAGVASALTTMCAEDSCPAATLRTALTKFSAACNDELTVSKNADVIRTYDVLYTLQPLKAAMCSKDDNDKWCLSSVSTYIDAATKSQLQTPLLSKRADAVYPNSATYCSTNLAFMFLKPALPVDALCTTCTRNIISSYITFESDTPYTPGLDNSQFLCGQTELYNSVNENCGATFLQGVVQAAGGISSGFGSTNAASRVASIGLSGIVVAVAAVASFVFN